MKPREHVFELVHVVHFFKMFASMVLNISLLKHWFIETFLLSHQYDGFAGWNADEIVHTWSGAQPCGLFKSMGPAAWDARSGYVQYDIFNPYLTDLKKR